jgi:hypothetical protein
MDFDLVVSDEQAKANVNFIMAKKGRVDVEAAISALQSDQPRALAVRLRPSTPDPRVIRRYQLVFGSYDQVFVAKGPRDLVVGSLGEPAGQGRVTCWGSGRVNFRSADVPVMRVVLAGILDETQLDLLKKYRAAVPDCTLDDALKQLELTKDNLQKAQDILTGDSSCQSLWVIARGKSRDWYSLHVAQAGDAENDAQSWTFSW